MEHYPPDVGLQLPVKALLRKLGIGTCVEIVQMQIHVRSLIHVGDIQMLQIQLLCADPLERKLGSGGVQSVGRCQHIKILAALRIGIKQGITVFQMQALHLQHILLQKLAYVHRRIEPLHAKQGVRGCALHRIQQQHIVHPKRNLGECGEKGQFDRTDFCRAGHKRGRRLVYNRGQPLGSQHHPNQHSGCQQYEPYQRPYGNQSDFYRFLHDAVSLP